MVQCPSCGEDNPPKFRLCGYCGTPLASSAAPPAAPHEVRKTVTLVFSDLKDSTALGERLDAEALHEVKERYFSAMADEIRRHGGKIEKYIGDAIMAVFGLPRAREDDALRAVRAAVGMRDALDKLNQGLRQRYAVALGNRTGINTGEVVANIDPGADQKLATGDAVNVAARLEQAAPVNQIYIGEMTYQLVRDAVEAEQVEALELKGKAERVPAYRLVSVQGIEGNARRVDTPVVGREGELAALAQVYREVVDGPAVRLVTVIGDAGAGKSRLVVEVIERIATGAQVVRGRCLPYGDGITFWPLVTMLREAAAIQGDDPPELARSKVLGLVGERDVADRLAAATGLSTATFPLPELAWAARKFLETLAAHGPVVAVIDDIHWAETAFLELIEHVLEASAGLPILMLTTSRHDLLEEHPEWGQRPGSTRLELKPLDAAASAQVVANLIGSAGLPQDVIERIVTAAEGNPLYVEHLLAMLIDSGALRLQDGGWVRSEGYTDVAVPPTIHALLEARLDGLGRLERDALEPASVIGLEFPRPALEAMTRDNVRATIGTHLDSLTHKRFIHPFAHDPADPVYRFHHHLVRETVYGALLKRARASLHIEFVRWADRANAESGRALEFQEILGYHLEQAHHYLSELGPLDTQGVAIGRDAALRLASAAKRAFGRGDMHAAASLYQRAAAVPAEDDPERLLLLPELGEAWMELGDFAQARAVVAAAEAGAERAGNQRVKASAQLLGMRIRLFSAEAGNSSEQTLRMALEAIPLFEGEAAHPELAKAWRLIGFVHGIAARYGESSEAVIRSMHHARLAGDERLIARNAMGLSISTLLGPTPVLQAIGQCEQMLADGVSDRQAESKILCTLAQLRAMNGEVDLARDLYRRGRGLLRELGQGLNAAMTGIDLLTVELLGGDLAAAERDVRPDYEFLERAGETYAFSTMAALLSRVVRDQGRDAEALAFSQVAEKSSAADDVESQALWRSIRAPIIARAGDLVEAETLARSAVDLSSQTDAPQMQADTLAELASVLHVAGRRDEARHAIDAAIEIYRGKGDVVSTARSVAWASGLGQA
jgi:class 3 adenylate cyclase/tetratricopeptide (TPR) repeat protein